MSAIILHPFGDYKVLRAVVTPHSAGNAMLLNALREELEDGLRAIVIVDTKSRYHVGFSVDEAMDHDFEPYEA